MIISVNVQLQEDDSLAYAPDAAAMQVLVALGADQTKDSCQLYVQSPLEPGFAGKPLTPEGPPAE